VDRAEGNDTWKKAPPSENATIQLYQKSIQIPAELEREVDSARKKRSRNWQAEVAYILG
jgi:hypothetical protein